MFISPKKIVSISIIAVLLVGSHYLGFSEPLENITFKILYPLKIVTYKISSSTFGFLGTIDSIKDLRADNARLWSENQRLKVEIAELTEVKQENKDLRVQLGFQERSGLKTQEAKVIGLGLDSGGQSLIIDQGLNNGLVAGQAVVSAEGFLVGVLAEVRAYNSQVLMITDQNSLLSVRLQDTRVAGLIKGEHGLSLRLIEIPDIEELKKGQKVITSGLSELIPEGILIGEVNEVLPANTALFQSAKLKLLAQFNKLEKVFIVKP